MWGAGVQSRRAERDECVCERSAPYPLPSNAAVHHLDTPPPHIQKPFIPSGDRWSTLGHRRGGRFTGA